jgi:uncharacterized membrane protein (DUF2068 family)
MNIMNANEVLPHTHPVARRRTLRAIAIFEAFKGCAVLVGSLILASVLHHDIRHIAKEMIWHFGLNPSSHYPSIFLHYADVLHQADLHTLVLMAWAYIAVRLLEAYGLWYGRIWAEWIGALSGGLYIPFEIHHLIHRPSVLSAFVFLGNVFIVGFLGFQLTRRIRLSA